MNKEKYFSKTTNEELEIGKQVFIEGDWNGNHFNGIYTINSVEGIKSLVEMGLAYVANEETRSFDTDSLRTILIERLEKKLAPHAEATLATIHQVNKGAVLSIMLKELAVVLDSTYPDHISNCEEYWVFDFAQGCLKKIPRAYIKTFKHIAVFRTIEDAKLACSVLRDSLKTMYGK